MKPLKTLILALLLFPGCATPVVNMTPSEGTLNITYFGTACFLIDDGTHRIITDPGTFLIPRLSEDMARQMPEGALVLVTHDDFDHVNRLNALPTPQMVIGTKETAKRFPALQVNTDRAIVYPSIPLKKRVMVREIGILHGVRHGKEHRGYEITIAGRVIYFLGDGVRLTQELEKGPDLLFITLGGLEANVENAVKLVARLEPKVVIPMHWEVLIPSDRKARAFKKRLSEVLPETLCVIPPFYETLVIDLLDGMK